MTNPNFRCEQCKTLISVSPYGQLNECEHYPFDELPSKETHRRTDFMYLVAEFARVENCVTRSSIREILKRRLDQNDVS